MLLRSKGLPQIAQITQKMDCCCAARFCHEWHEFTRIEMLLRSKGLPQIAQITQKKDCCCAARFCHEWHAFTRIEMLLRSKVCHGGREAQKNTKGIVLKSILCCYNNSMLLCLGGS